MSILCRIDRSDASVAAAHAAAHWAVRMNEPLHLIHALAASGGQLGAKPDNAIRFQAATRLARLTEQLHHLDADVHAHLSVLSSDEALEDASRRYRARLIVAAEERGDALDDGWSLADARRMAVRAQVPVLVVRDAEPFKAWVRKGQHLRVALHTNVAAAPPVSVTRWLRRLADLGPCEMGRAPAYGPPRPGYPPAMDLVVVPTADVAARRSVAGEAFTVPASSGSSVVYVPAAERRAPKRGSARLHLDAPRFA